MGLSMWKKIEKFFQEDLWNVSLKKLEGKKRFFYRFLRIGSLSIIRFFRNRCPLGASSLTFFSLMAIVPFFALALLITKAFGLHERFQTQMIEHFPEQAEGFQNLFQDIDRYLENIQRGAFAAFSIVILVISVFFLLVHLEKIFNQIWQVKKGKRVFRIAFDYFVLIFAFPLFFLFANSVAVYFSHFFLSIAAFVRYAVIYFAFGFSFWFLYIFIPNKKVSWGSASIGALIAAVLYQVVQRGYLYFQFGVGKYGAIYGTMAALPLFLIWLQISWYIILYGAEVCYACELSLEKEFQGPIKRMSQSARELFLLWIVALGIKGKISVESLEQDYGFPRFFAQNLLLQLEKFSILREESGGYRTVESYKDMKISSLFSLLRTSGENAFPFIDPKRLSFLQTIERNKTIEDVSHSL